VTDAHPAAALLMGIAKPETLLALSPAQWTQVLGLARREGLIGILAQASVGTPLPERVRLLLDDAAREIAYFRQLCAWECERLAKDLDGLEQVPVILLKGAAYSLGDLPPAPGRAPGDLDILVPRSWLGPVEAQLRARGWVSDGLNAYDERYYREWVHELPPLKHPERAMELDVHHTILPLTGRVQPNADALIAERVAIPGTRFFRLSTPDMLLHMAAHVLQDGDLSKGLRTLVDGYRVIIAAQDDGGLWDTLLARAQLHGLTDALGKFLRLLRQHMDAPVPASVLTKLGGGGLLFDTLARHRLYDPDGLSFSGWLARNAFYIRAHWLKMPPLMLAKHLWTKARMQSTAN
jgi:hypothetical protein